MLCNCVMPRSLVCAAGSLMMQLLSHANAREF
jgi:hypothetical protein